MLYEKYPDVSHITSITPEFLVGMVTTVAVIAIALMALLVVKIYGSNQKHD